MRDACVPFDIEFSNRVLSLFLSFVLLFSIRLNTVVPSPKPEIAADAVVWHLVKLFGNPHESGLRQRCTNLIQSLARWQPDVRDTLEQRRRSLDQAVQGAFSYWRQTFVETLHHNFLESN